MKIIAKCGLILSFWFLSLTSVSAHCWGHHGDCWHSGNDMGICADCARRYTPPCQNGHFVPPTSGQKLETLKGKVTEVNYLPGASASTAMVEIQLQGDSQSTPVRLGPTGFLKRNELGLKEGDVIQVRGYRVCANDVEFLVATEIEKNGKNLVLRNSEAGLLGEEAGTPLKEADLQNYLRAGNTFSASHADPFKYCDLKSRVKPSEIP